MTASGRCHNSHTHRDSAIVVLQAAWRPPYSRRAAHLASGMIDYFAGEPLAPRWLLGTSARPPARPPALSGRRHRALRPPPSGSGRRVMVAADHHYRALAGRRDSRQHRGARRIYMTQLVSISSGASWRLAMQTGRRPTQRVGPAEAIIFSTNCSVCLVCRAPAGERAASLRRPKGGRPNNAELEFK